MTSLGACNNIQGVPTIVMAPNSQNGQPDGKAGTILPQLLQ